MVSTKFPTGSKVTVHRAGGVGDKTGVVIPLEDYDCGNAERELILDPEAGPWVVLKEYSTALISGWAEHAVTPIKAGDLLYTVEDCRSVCAECDDRANWSDYLCRECRAQF